jgi:hypothetical protein
MNHRPNLRVVLFLALSGVASDAGYAVAQNHQFTEEVRTTCSHSQQGLLQFWECVSTIAYLEASTSEVYYCNGSHIVVTTRATVQRASADATCTLSFRPFPDSGNYTLLDLTKGQLPSLPASKSNLYPDGIGWIARTDKREIQFCSQFVAGLAGTQARCAAATFR